MSSRTNTAVEQDWDAEIDDGLCDRCGGDGYIMAHDGDGSDWGEDTYCGPMDATIDCRACGGTGFRK